MSISPTTTDVSTPSPPSRPNRLRRLLRQRSVRLALAAWVLVNVALIALAHGRLPFDLPRSAGLSATDHVVAANVELLEVALLMVIVHRLTRRRQVPDLAARAPARPAARRETVLLLGYGVLGSLGGLLLGRALGWHAFSFHLDGMLFGTHQRVVPAEALCWAAYNVVVFAVLPFAFFRRRYSTEELGLRSSDRRGDAVVIAVVLVLEAAFQLVLGSSAILHLRPHQVLLGAPLTFALSFAGTVLPTMIFIYAILIPRYLRLTGSPATTVILGGLTYTLMHFFDGWTRFQSPTDVALSVLFLLLTYTVPGMFKTYLTLRTANAWVHVWAYHAIAPHTLEDTPLFVKVFQIH